MILVTAVGWSLQTYFAVTGAAFYGAILGLIVARFVPAKSTCRIAVPNPD